MSILDQIRHKKFSIVAYERLHPQQVYLGQEEYEQLLKELQTNIYSGVVLVQGNILTHVDGLKVVRVLEESHLEVV